MAGQLGASRSSQNRFISDIYPFPEPPFTEPDIFLPRFGGVMTDTRNPTRTATAAIAAVLALASTPLAAQEAAPTIVLPDVTTQAAPAAPVAAPAPVAPAPATPAPVMTSAPVVQAVPQPETAPAEPVAAPAAAATAAPRAAARTPAAPAAPPVAAAPAPAPLTPEPANPEAVPAFSDAFPAETVAPVAAPAPTQAAAPVDGDGVATEALLAGGAVLGLGLLGFVAFRRRKPGQPTQAAPVVQKPRVVPAATPVTTTVAAPASAAAHIHQTDQRPAAPAQWAAAQRTTQPISAANSGAVALPRTSPEDFDERDALLRRMAMAKPDKANPFRSPKARFRRARLILQSLGQDFSDRDPQFDTSDYPQHWPEVARRRYSAAA
jgi:hypothetical protein